MSDDAYDRWRDDVATGIYQGPRTFYTDHEPISPPTLNCSNDNFTLPKSITSEKTMPSHDNNSPRMRQLRAAAGTKFFAYARGR
jgi:hypothetical protein